MQGKYDEMEQEILNKVSVEEHKQQLEALSKSKNGEIKIIHNENSALKARLSTLNVEKDRLAMKVRGDAKSIRRRGEGV